MLGLEATGGVLIDDIDLRRRLGRVRTSNSDTRLGVSLASEITDGPRRVVVSIEGSDEVTETTVFLDADEMMDRAIGTSHRCDGTGHD